jgi:hypothetical protein
MVSLLSIYLRAYVSQAKLVQHEKLYRRDRCYLELRIDLARWHMRSLLKPEKGLELLAPQECWSRSGLGRVGLAKYIGVPLTGFVHNRTLDYGSSLERTIRLRRQ